MANIQSQIKRNRQNEKRRLRNRDFRGAARSAVKQALGSMTSDQASAGSVTLAIRALDKAARKGAIHPRNAARRKSRLLKRLAALGIHGPTVSAQAAVPAAGRESTGRGRAAKAQQAETSAAEPKPKKTVVKKAAKKAAGKKTTK